MDDELFLEAFANMWDEDLARAYKRKFFDREISYMQDAVKDSIKKLLGDCKIDVTDFTKITVTEVASPPSASFDIRLTGQRITFSFYRIDDTIFLVPLEMRTKQDPPPMAWAINENVSPMVYQNYRAEFDSMFDESLKIYSKTQ